MSFFIDSLIFNGDFNQVCISVSCLYDVFFPPLLSSPDSLNIASTCVLLWCCLNLCIHFFVCIVFTELHVCLIPALVHCGYVSFRLLTPAYLVEEQLWICSCFFMSACVLESDNFWTRPNKKYYINRLWLSS